MIDEDGFRPNVGIIIHNDAGRVLWAHRIGRSLDEWQFPQGGIKAHESPVTALYRELEEELGLSPTHVAVIGQTRDWLRYRLPQRFRRRSSACIGQKQRWFLLRLLGAEDDVQVSAGEWPEFDHWRWVDYWHPAREVVFFKRDVYRRALRELAPLLYHGRVRE